MKILQLIQGSTEWKKTRMSHFCASEAAAMLGFCDKTTRNALLHMKATGCEKEFSSWAQENILNKGHEVEALARPIVEAMISDELYPATGAIELDGLPLLASFDGLNMDFSVGFEHKQLNQALVAAVDAETVPDTHWPQLEQQLLISGADHIIFAVSDGTEENFHYVSYHSKPERRESLVKGWKQFQKDLAEYVQVEHSEIVKAESKAIIPTLQFQITGSVSDSNLVQFKRDARFYLEQINTELQTDEDFGQAITDGKDCESAEKALKALKEKALAESADISEVMSALDEYQEKFRQMRLKLGKMVKSEKEARRKQIIDVAAGKWQILLTGFRQDFNLLPAAELTPDFAEACKGKKSLSSMQNAVDTALAQATIKLNDAASLFSENLSCIDASQMFLFGDLQQLINQPHEAFRAIVQSRVIQFQEQQRQKREAEEKARIEAEKQAAVKAESGAINTETSAQEQYDRAHQAASIEAFEKKDESILRNFIQNTPAPGVNHETVTVKHEPANQVTAAKIEPSVPVYEPLKVWPPEKALLNNVVMRELAEKLGEAENHIAWLEEQLRIARAA